MLVSVEGHRWAIEDSFETAKNELGLDHNETRSWHGWHRHVSLVMLAFAMMAAIRHRANTTPTQQTIPQIFATPPLYPLVHPGNPPHRKPACAAAHPTGPHHRMVDLATSPSGSGKASPSQAEAKIATVMLNVSGSRSARRPTMATAVS